MTVVQVLSGDTVLVRYDRDPVIKAKGDQKSKGESSRSASHCRRTARRAWASAVARPGAKR